MAAVRLQGLTTERWTPGIAFHHACDAAFHAHPAFVTACAEGVETLTAAEVARGPARAVAHVGFEMLLDGALAASQRAQAPETGGQAHIAYREALALGSAPSPSHPGVEPLAWERLRHLCERLEAAPLPAAYDSAEFVTERLYSILARRPRLALHARDRAAVLDYCHRVRELTRAVQASLVSDVLRAAAGT